MPESYEENPLTLLNIQEDWDNLSIDDQLLILEKLRTIPSTEAVECLNSLVIKTKNPDVLLNILKFIGKYNSKSSSSNLVELLLWKEACKQNLCDPEKYLKVRCMTATILGNIKEYSAVVPLLYVLNNKDENYKLRLSCAEALGKIGDKYAVAPLIEVVTDEDEKSVYLRESAAKALGMIGDSRAVDPLLMILETKKGLIDKFTFLKERVIEAIGKFKTKDERTIKVLMSSLIDESAYIRLEAINALSEIDDERVVPLIEKMLLDPEEDVARGAIDALYNILGEDYIINLLKNENLAGWCKDQIELILDEEEETEINE